MTLLTKEMKAKIPPLYSQENVKDPIAHVKFICLWSDWVWWVVEFDGEDLCFGKVKGFETELGYFRLSELEAVEGPGGMQIERDLFFKPIPLSQCE